MRHLTVSRPGNHYKHILQSYLQSSTWQRLAFCHRKTLCLCVIEVGNKMPLYFSTFFVLMPDFLINSWASGLSQNTRILDVLAVVSNKPTAKGMEDQKSDA